MDCNEYIINLKKIQDILLQFLDNNDQSKDAIQTLNKENNKNEICYILNLISTICNNHHQSPDFFQKIEQVILFFSDDIKNNYSNIEIFNLFKKNKRILLYLIQKEILIINEIQNK